MGRAFAYISKSIRWYAVKAHYSPVLLHQSDHRRAARGELPRRPRQPTRSPRSVGRADAGEGLAGPVPVSLRTFRSSAARCC